MDVDPRRLRVLLAVVRAEGVTGASRVLHLTPQAISQQIASLEEELGVELFDRTHRRLAPTAIGLTLAGHAERLEAELVAAGRAVAAATGRVSGVVRMAAFQTAIRWLVVEALPLLRAEQPGVVPMVIELYGAGVDKSLRTGEIDLMLDECDDDQEEPSAAGIEVRTLRRDPYFVVASASLARELRTPKALAAQRWIAAPEGTSLDLALQRLAKRGKFEPIVAHVCKEFPSVLALVAAGEGVAIVPELALVDARGVEPCPIAGLGARKLLAIQRVSKRGTEPAVDAVVRALMRKP
ncbi:LysR family transcriptional regulator [Pendulispora brunnea]|uniref:LysR family transcriptional regulator n=1 Tax=Pendulispora brunnea TaxID=2905690 RepID=A0ABZ2K0M5_9BACT